MSLVGTTCLLKGPVEKEQNQEKNKKRISGVIQNITESVESVNTFRAVLYFIATVLKYSPHAPHLDTIDVSYFESH